MVQRLTTSEEAQRLRNWFLEFMQGVGTKPILGPGERLSRTGFLVGPTQLCNRAGVNGSLGTRLFGDGSSARLYVPFAEYLRRLALALRDLLTERGHPQAEKVTVIRAYIEAGYLELQDVVDFLKAEGVDGWMREEDCLAGFDLRGLSEEGRLVVEEMYRFQLFKETVEQV